MTDNILNLYNVAAKSVYIKNSLLLQSIPEATLDKIPINLIVNHENKINGILFGIKGTKMALKHLLATFLPDKIKTYINPDNLTPTVSTSELVAVVKRVSQNESDAPPSIISSVGFDILTQLVSKDLSALTELLGARGDLIKSAFIDTPVTTDEPVVKTDTSSGNISYPALNLMDDGNKNISVLDVQVIPPSLPNTIAVTADIHNEHLYPDNAEPKASSVMASTIGGSSNSVKSTQAKLYPEECNDTNSSDSKCLYYLNHLQSVASGAGSVSSRSSVSRKRVNSNASSCTPSKKSCQSNAPSLVRNSINLINSKILEKLSDGLKVPETPEGVGAKLLGNPEDGKLGDITIDGMLLDDEDEYKKPPDNFML